MNWFVKSLRFVRAKFGFGIFFCLIGVAAITPAKAAGVEPPRKSKPEAAKPAITGNWASSPSTKTPVVIPSPAVVEKQKPTKKVRKKRKVRKVRKITKRKKQTTKKKSEKATQPKSQPTVQTSQKQSEKKVADILWWENVANPIVFNFRDCASEFAAGQIAKGVQASATGMITTAMRTSCKVEFAKLAGALIGGLGEKKSNAMLTELATTTFLPSVKSAMKSATEKRIASVVKIPDPKTIETAKAQMFHCFVQKTDLLSAARSTPPHVIADSVIIGCQNRSDAFFDMLFAGSKASPSDIKMQKDIALSETYRLAIIKRVLATRKTPNKIKTATQ